MNELFENINDHSNLQLLKDTLNYHFGEILSNTGFSIEDHPILLSCMLIEYLLYYWGNAWRVQRRIQYDLPETVRSILDRKFHSDNECLEEAIQKTTELNNEILKIRTEKMAIEQQNYSLKTENNRLQKIIDQQNWVLRKLQDRLDSVNNSGQQIG